MAYELGPNDLELLLLGGCFFGSGGGGTVVSARHLATHFHIGDYYPTDRVRVVDVDEAKDGDTVMVAYMGAPEAIDKVLYPEGPVLAVRQVQARLEAEGRHLAYVVPPESGALGFVVACLVAAKLGLAVVDADGAGRAVPSLPMLTFASHEVNPRPAFLVSQKDLCVELDVTPRSGSNGGATHQQDVSAIIEHMMRPIITEPEFGQFGGLAMWVMDSARLAEALPIRGTLSRALALGQALQAGQVETPQAMIDFLFSHFDLYARPLFGPGMLVSAEVQTTGGFDVGKMHIEADGARCTVLFQNESLLAWSSAAARPIGMAPDSLAYFVGGPGQKVFSNGDLVMEDGSLNPAVRGRPVTVLGIEASPALRQPGGLILGSFMNLLEQLGYLGPYVPVEAAHPAVTGEPV
ncbi:DUF917 domain-containing protein [Pseudomonas sp. CAU 1711]|uniref:DUF917 domain-containing protein n=1 Tax=Pseudomonas sp. CAU 1711 TaxID=3140356 RepID=UPI0032609874